MKNFDKKKFKTRIINIMKKNSPEDSVEKISNLINPYTQEEIGKNKAIKIYTLNIENVVVYKEDIYGNNISKYNKLISDKISRIYNII